ncbi:hypothetical protein Gotur_027654, partial [Gossypium turneri]
MHCSQAVQDTPTWKDIHEEGSSVPLFTRHNNNDVIPPNDLERRIEQLELKCYRAREKKKRKADLERRTNSWSLNVTEHV